MTDNELLDEAQDFYKKSNKQDTPEWVTAQATQSIAASLLVIARDSQKEFISGEPMNSSLTI